MDQPHVLLIGARVDDHDIVPPGVVLRAALNVGCVPIAVIAIDGVDKVKNLLLHPGE